MSREKSPRRRPAGDGDQGSRRTAFDGRIAILWQARACAQDIQIEVTEVPYREVYAFGSPWFDFGGGHDVAGDGQTINANFAGFGLRIWGARQDRDIQLQLAVGFDQYRVEDLGITDLRSVSVLDMMWGGRYYPRYPTFGLGRSVAVRATFFGEGGLAMGTSPSFFAPTVVFGGGLAFSGRENPSGVMLEIVYRPLSQDLEHETDSGRSFRDTPGLASLTRCPTIH